MAQCFPPHPPSGTPFAERKVFEALSKLPDPWMIFHSVGWQSLRGGRQADGEADFVALHPSHGLVIIEVKGGRISIENGQWFSENSRTGQKKDVKDPFKQATDAKYALLRFLDELQPPVRGVYICHGAALPGGSVAGDLSPAAPREIIWDGADITRPKEAMKRLVNHWKATSRLNKAQVQQIKNLLAPTTKVRRTLRVTIAESAEQLIQLTDGQVQALTRLRRNRRALIYGGAGTGKTVLAVERAKTLARENFRVLLTCYNKPLGDYLARQVVDDELIVAGSFHSVCLWEAKQAGISVPGRPTAQWWGDAAPDVLVEAVEKTSRQFDAVVVDEGQDFTSTWFDALMMVLRDPDQGPFYVFADVQQAIYTRGWKPPGDWAAYDLDINCRNTIQIAERVAAVFGDAPETLGAEGEDPLFVVADDDDAALQAVKNLVRGLMNDEMLTPDQIAVISPERSFVEALQAMKVGSARFVQLDKRGLVAETLYRFKGMEADVVIVDLRSVDLSDPTGKGLAYVAMSRARAFLMVLGSKKQAEELKWPKRQLRIMENR